MTTILILQAGVLTWGLGLALIAVVSRPDSMNVQLLALWILLYLNWLDKP